MTICGIADLGSSPGFHPEKFVSFKIHIYIYNMKHTNDNINKIPALYYPNAESCKLQIYEDNKGKSGIYCWKNNITGKCYVGSATNLNRRISKYFSAKLLKNILLVNNSIIYSSLLKYNYSNFSFNILKYCELNLLLIKEQYYLDLLKPKYNICKIAGSRLNVKHSNETILKFKNRKFSNDSIFRMRSAKTRIINHLLITGHITIVINKKNNNIKQYFSIRSAAKDLNAAHGSLIYCRNNNLLFRNTYLIIKLMKLTY